MATSDCGRDFYLSKDGKCCERCSAGKYVLTQCNDTKRTQCAICQHGHYTADKNHLDHCLPCRSCTAEHQKVAKECEAHSDRRCECVAGFYCMEADCVRCQAMTLCPVGHGVRVKGAPRNDTVCAPCEHGTYSNVSDYYSPCRRHTSCDDLGRVLLSSGSNMADTVCGDFKCSYWILSTSVLAALVLVSLLVALLAVIRWKLKWKSHRTALRGDRKEPAFVEPEGQEELPFPSKERNDQWQESSMEKACTQPLYAPDNNMANYCTPVFVEDKCPSPAAAVSVQCPMTDGNDEEPVNGFITSMRAHSEPQEDEWDDV